MTSSEDREVLGEPSGDFLSANFRQPSVFPRNIISWQRKHLEELNIKISFQPETSPMQLVKTKIQKAGIQNYTVDVYERLKAAEDKEKKYISSLVKYVLRNEFMGMLKKMEYSIFEDVNINTLHALDMYVDSKQPCYFFPKDAPENLKFWFDRFAIHARSFAYFLYKMVEMKVKGQTLHQCHFQHLFDSFTKMFGLHSGTSSLCDQDDMRIGKTDVFGGRNIAFTRCSVIRDDKELENPRVVAVCEVKKERPLVQESNVSPPSSKRKKKEETSSFCSALNTDKSVVQISGNLISQHGALLLGKYPESNRIETILGMVVQETFVTFTSLTMTESHFQRIQSGRYVQGGGDTAELIYTRPFNFLIAEDMKYIIEPLIQFGLEQG